MIIFNKSDKKSEFLSDMFTLVFVMSEFLLFSFVSLSIFANKLAVWVCISIMQFDSFSLYSIYRSRPCDWKWPVRDSRLSVGKYIYIAKGLCHIRNIWHYGSYHYSYSNWIFILNFSVYMVLKKHFFNVI